MAQYDAFADFYNRDWGHDYHAQLFPVVERLLLPHLAPRDSILDVGCGTGVLAAHLETRGFPVTGIDPSAKMLEFARQKSPRSIFLQADARTFQLAAPCTASVATFEAMNHLLEPEHLAQAFRQIAHHTARLFVFDMNRETSYDLFWNGTQLVEDSGVSCRLTSSYDPTTRLAVCRTEVGEQVTEIHERYYDSELIQSLLTKAGFSKVCRYDARRDLGMWGDVSIGRFFYQCFR